VRRELNERARERTLMPANAEIRFVADADSVTVTLSSETGACEVVPFWGPYQGVETYAVGSEPTTIEIERHERLAAVDAEREPGAGTPWSSRVWRLRPHSPSTPHRTDPLYLHDVDGRGVSPPDSGDCPDRRLVAYGTSITEGVGATRPQFTYPARAARRLGFDALNLGTGASAFCEAAVADHIAGRDDWDAAVLELSTNMIGAGFSVETFRERATYMVETVADAHPGCPVLCVTILPQIRDLRGDETVGRFRDVLREVVAEADRSTVHLLAGEDALAFEGLSADVLHPGDAGMIQIGDAVASALGDRLE
jgi:lysophospholipase L1-like esterase